jgi:hypothetical protein
MKKVTLDNYKEDKYYPKVVKAVDRVLSSEKYVTPIGVFRSMGLLEQKDIESWRKGQVPYLERVIGCNLHKASRILRILRFCAHDLNLKPSMTVYNRKVRGKKIPLRFTKFNDQKLEEAYARHFVVVGKLSNHQARHPSPKSGSKKAAQQLQRYQ